MKFFFHLFLLASALLMVMVKACDQCSPEFIEVQEQLQVVIESCNQVQNTQAENLTVDIQVLVEAFYDVRAKVEAYTEILTEVEVDVLTSTLGDVHIALKACIETVVELKGIMVELGVDITIIEQSVSDLWVYINLSFDEIIEICPSNAHKKVNPPCNQMRKGVKSCCNAYNQTCGDCDDYSSDCPSQ